MFSGFQKNKNLVSIFFAILGALLVSYLVYSPRIPLQLNIKLGDISDQTIRSPQYIEFQTKEDQDKPISFALRDVNLLIPSIPSTHLFKKN